MVHAGGDLVGLREPRAGEQARNRCPQLCFCSLRAAPRSDLYAVRPDERSAVRADAEGARDDGFERDQRDRDARPELLHGIRPGFVRHSGEEGQARPDQVERGDVVRTDPDMLDPAAEVDGQLRGDIAARAERVSRAGDVVGDRCATFRLVRREQGRRCPPAHHPGELPAEVPAVGDREVQSGPAARRHPMGRVAHEEDGIGAEACRPAARRRRSARGARSAPRGRRRPNAAWIRRRISSGEGSAPVS